MEPEDEDDPGAGESGGAEDEAAEERAQVECWGGPPGKKTPGCWRWWGDMRGSWAETGVAGGWSGEGKDPWGMGEREGTWAGDMVVRAW